MGFVSNYFTIGMAGHIDHGKTALTEALTGVQTDRLKEEKERNISIEPGFAPFIQEEELEVSLIDVPGHEDFIRQMIAGVAGIDLVLLVIAADEGVMPQTKEHLDILTLLGIENGCIVITKIDVVEQELLDLVVDDIREHVNDTFLESAPIHFVDSISMKGIPDLKAALREQLTDIKKRKTKPSFRLPIDQVFTVKGQGVVVRGTVYDGTVRQGDKLVVLPSRQEVRVRQIQRHHQEKTTASKGQRTAINLGGVSYEDIARGDVLVRDDFFSVSDRIDIVFHPLKDIRYKIKQRQLIKLHIGTAEVMGKVIFFDRNEVNVNESEDILCQLQLNEPVVTTRGDRFIIRRPTPKETMGGGWVIEPNATKHRFGEMTIEALKHKKEGTAKDRIFSLLEKEKMLTRDDILKQVAISEKEFNDVKAYLLEVESDLYTLSSTVQYIQEQITTIIQTYHKQFPMRIGMNKAEIVSELKTYPLKLVDFVFNKLIEAKKIKTTNQYVSLFHMSPSLPPEWEKRLKQVEKDLIAQGVEVDRWDELLNKHHIPVQIQKEFYQFLTQTNRAYVFDDGRLISKIATDEALNKLMAHTRYQNFNLQTAREVLPLTRKNLVPLLELFDTLGYTKRIGNERTWMKKA